MLRIGSHFALIAAASMALIGIAPASEITREMHPTRRKPSRSSYENTKRRGRDKPYKGGGGKKSWSLKDNWAKIRASRIANVMRKRRERKRGRKAKEYLRWRSSWN